MKQRVLLVVRGFGGGGFVSSRLHGPHDDSGVARRLSLLRNSNSNSNNKASAMLMLQLLLVLLFSLSSKCTVMAQQGTDCYPVQIDIFASEETCQNGDDPIASGQLYGDDTCRTTAVMASDTSNTTYKFPGRYIAKCNGTSLEITDSGCINADCSNPNGGNVCSREFTPASFYSRLNPPLFQLQSSTSIDYRFCMVLSDPDANKIVFTMTGDCSVACGDRTAVPGSSNSTANTDIPVTGPPSEPPASSVVQTSEPTVAPTPEETTAAPPPPSLRPTVAKGGTDDTSPTESPTTDPAASSPSAPTTGSSGGGGATASPSSTTGSGSGGKPFSPTLRPSSSGTPRTPTSASGATSPQNSNSSASNNNSTAIIVGSVVAGVCAVVVVLLIGFFLGVFRQRKIDASRSRDSSGAPSQDGQALGHAGGSSPNIPTALASTTATARTPPMFESTQIIIPDHEDDVSTLGTPLGVSFLEETTTVGESSYKHSLTKQSQLLLDDVWHQRHNGIGVDTDNYDDAGVISGSERDRTATEDSEFMSESKVVCSDDTSFEQAFDESNEVPSGTDGTATLADGSLHFIVTAPPGKLGMVIDDYINVTGRSPPPPTPTTSNRTKTVGGASSSSAVSTPGTPTVHALKDDSVLRRRGVRVGDLLETVDGVDVTELNCLDVSRMITGRSSAARVLGFARRRVTEC